MTAGRTLLTVLLALTTATAAVAGAPSVRQSVTRGNELYRAGDYEAALESYLAAGESDPLPLYNAACALQKLGRTAEAETLLQRVDAMVRQDDLAAATRYNLGAAAIENARERAAAGDAPAALEDYKRAARLYRDALAINPADTDAARNIEIAGREAKALLDQIRAQQQAMEQMAKQLDELQQQQQDQAEQNAGQPQNNQDQPQDQGGQQPAQDQGGQPQQSQQQQQQQQQQQSQQQQSQSQQQQSSQDASQRQQELSEQTQAARDQLRDLQQQMQQSQQGSTAATPKDNPLDQAGDSMDEAMQQQQRAASELEKGQRDEAAGAQQEAAENLRKALDELTGQNSDRESEENKPGDESEAEDAQSDENSPAEADASENQQDQQDQDQQQGEGSAQQDAQANGGSGDAGNEQADPLDALAETLLDKEKRDRETLQRIRDRQRARSTPVEKDW